LVRRTLGLCLFAAVYNVALPPSLAAQTAGIYYVYDDLNRLSAVVNQQGDVAVYSYDAVGNILKIERFDVSGLPGAVGISYFAPSVGRVGTAVQIFGKGFSPTPGLNTLAFNGTIATVTSAAPNRLVASVPTGATTGLISLSTPLGSASSAVPFKVLGTSLAVAPTQAEVQVGLTRQFSAAESGTPTTNVRWAVNGVAGGDPSTGTISASGLFTAPAFIPVPATLTVSAIHQDDSAVTGSAQVTIIPAGPMYAVARGVSVGFAAPPAVVDKTVTSAVSVQFAAPLSTTLSSAPAVTVVVTPPAMSSASSSLVAIAVEPAVTGVAPAAAAAGTSTSITLTGYGLADTTAITFLRHGVADATITASQITPGVDGTSMTANIAISGTSPLGSRVLQVTAGGRTSTPAATAGNVFTVQ